MTAQHQSGATPAVTPGVDPSTSGGTAETAKAEAANVASTAAEGARDVASEASAQVKAVASEAKQQVDRLVSQGRYEVRQQAEQRSAQAAGQLRTLSEQFRALAESRPEDAGPLLTFVREAEDRLRSMAWRMEQGGPQGIVDDVNRFARRRPGVFLAGALGMGFVVGRLVRAAAANQQDDSQDAVPTTYAATPNGPAYGTSAQLPPPSMSTEGWSS
jgi:hypothetical protein